jgi:hypothetical protein
MECCLVESEGALPFLSRKLCTFSQYHLAAELLSDKQAAS